MNILFECHQGIGDLIMLLPAIRIIMEEYDFADAYILVASGFNVEFVKKLNLFKKIYVLNKKSYFDGSLNLLIDMKKIKYDLGFAFSYSEKGIDILLMKFLRCKKIYGIDTKRRILKPHETVNRINHDHMVYQGLEFVRELGLRTDISFPILKGICEYNERVENREKPYITIVIGTGDNFYRKRLKRIYFNGKQWEIDRYERLSKLINRAGYGIKYIGSSKENEEIRKNEKLLRYGNNLCGKLNVDQLINVLLGSEIVIGGDTGPMHLAGALGVKTLSLFGPTDFDKYGPFSDVASCLTGKCQYRPCWNTPRYIECHDRKCLDISADKVFEETIQIITKNR